MAIEPIHASSPAADEPQGSTSFWESRTDSERRWIILLGINFAVLAVFGGIYLFTQSLDETRREIAQYESALDALTEAGPQYLEAKRQEASKDTNANRFTPEILSKNRLQLTSFVATIAKSVDLKVDNYDEDQQPLKLDGRENLIVTENTVRVDIREADFTKLLQLLEKIEKSTEPVVIKRINIRDVRNKTGMVRADIVIATYTQKNQAS